MANLGLGTGLWACIIPTQTTNIISNPSLEYGSANWSALGGGATIGTTSYTQAFGAWSLQINYTAASEGAFYNAGTPAVGSYSLSAFVKGTSGHTIRLIAAEATNSVTLGSIAVTATGAWQPCSALFGMISGTGLNIIVRHTSPSAVGTVYVDGLQLESGTSPTTYCDGDQAGCSWQGAPHASQSQRSGQYRGGGSVVALADLGLQVNDMLGAGVMPIEVSTQSYAVIDGAEFQRQRAGMRKLTLTAKPLAGTSLGDFHVTRRTVWDALKPDLVTPQQPVRFLYVGAVGTQQLDAYYDSGLELGNMDGPIAENLGVSFIATDPYWYAPIQQGTTLVPRLNIGSAKYIVNRSPLGQWGTMGPSGSALDNVVGALIGASSGVLYVGGAFGSAAGTRVRFIAQWNPRTGAWGSLPGGTLNGAVSTLLEYPSGSIFAGGAMSLAGGTTANSIAFWNPSGSWGTTNGGGASGAGANIVGLTRGANGTLYAVGGFTSVAGTAGTFAAMYSPITDRWGTMTGFNNAGGAAGAGPIVNATGLDGKIYYAGAFNAVNGTTAGSIAFWNPKTSNWGTMAPGIANQVSSGVLALAVSPNGVLRIGGDFGSAGGGSVPNFTSWNGVAYQGYGSGVNAAVQSLFAGSDGRVFLSGAITVAGGAAMPQGGVIYNGASFTPIDAVIPNPGPMTQAADGTLYVSLSPIGSMMAASVVPLVNAGRAQVYPTLRMRNTSAGTARPFQLANTTTGQYIFFSGLALAPSEVATLVLTPGNRSFQSNYQGNIFGAILPGSNLASWSLLSGTNYISFFSDNDSLEVAFFYTPRGWSADSGTSY